MSSFSHLSATSHNSNNGNPKKHWRGARLVLLRHLGSGAPVCRDHAPAHPPPAGTARKVVRRQSTKSWPARPVVGNSVLGLRKSPSVHCSKPTAPLAYGCCRRNHGGGPILPAASQRAHVGELWRTGGYSGATRRPVIGRQFFLPICLNKAAHQSLLAQAGAHGATGATGTQGPQGAGAPVDPR